MILAARRAYKSPFPSPFPREERIQTYSAQKDGLKTAIFLTVRSYAYFVSSLPRTNKCLRKGRWRQRKGGREEKEKKEWGVRNKKRKTRKEKRKRKSGGMGEGGERIKREERRNGEQKKKRKKGGVGRGQPGLQN